MKRYAALLRGINISGKNKVPMEDLRKVFEAAAFEDVKTYLNSGNVVFSCMEEDTGALSNRIEEMLQRRFALDIPVFVLSMEALEDVLQNAPDWWGSDDPQIYDNLIFMLPPTAFSEVYAELGEPKAGLEKVMNYREAIFWSFRRKEYQKTNWWAKTASANIGARLTIRTANTIRKIVGR